MKAYYYIVFVLLLCILPSSCVLEGGVPGQAGGYVFYDKGGYSDGWRYLECAPEDAGGKTKNWDTANSRCDDYAYGGYDDWRLPSGTELSWMYSNLHKKGMGNFENDYDDYYWSKEGCFRFGNGFSHDTTYSSSNIYTRPVRQF
jgi:hypothetical protein